MHVNFTLAPGVATLIPVYEGDTPATVARAFIARHGLAGPQAASLEPLIAHLVGRSMAAAAATAAAAAASPQLGGASLGQLATAAAVPSN